MEQKPSTGRERKEFVLIDATAKQISTLGKLLPVLTFLVTEGKRETCHGYLALVLKHHRACEFLLRNPVILETTEPPLETMLPSVQLTWIQWVLKSQNHLCSES